MSIEIDHLSHVYHAHTELHTGALDDVSLSIPTGSWTCFIGQTGSGKSTLAQHLNAILRPTAGTVTVDGLTVGPAKKREKLDLRQVRRRVGLVFQYPEQQLFEETVRAELAFAPRNWGVPEAEIGERSSRALAAVGLDNSYLERSPFGLSGGEKRRVAIASVLTSQPDYLVLDEPTAGLDGRGRAQLLRLLDAIHKQGVAIVLITHDLEIVFSRADQVVVLEHGRLVCAGKPEDVAESLYRAPVPGMVLPDVLRTALLLRERGMRVPLTCDPERLAQAAARERRRGR